MICGLLTWVIFIFHSEVGKSDMKAKMEIVKTIFVIDIGWSALFTVVFLMDR